MTTPEHGPNKPPSKADAICDIKTKRMKTNELPGQDHRPLQSDTVYPCSTLTRLPPKHPDYAGRRGTLLVVLVIFSLVKVLQIFIIIVVADAKHAHV